MPVAAKHLTEVLEVVRRHVPDRNTRTRMFSELLRTPAGGANKSFQKTIERLAAADRTQ